MGGGSKVVEGDESELELGLGLGLGLGPGSRGGAWAERGRILTARDFTYSVGTMRASDYSSAASPPRSTQIVGWPPVGIRRMNSLVNVNQSVKFEAAEPEGNKTDVGQNDKSKDTLRTTTGNGKPGYVKVNMDRVVIGRKVDLNAYSSYENLARTLEEMFFKSGSAIGSGGSSQKKEIAMGSKLLDGSADYVLTYEDKEGDWMLVGDVPWRMFRGSVRRIRIMKTTEANGLAPRHQESLVE